VPFNPFLAASVTRVAVDDTLPDFRGPTPSAMIQFSVMHATTVDWVCAPLAGGVLFAHGVHTW
jgi:hypothetical protein